MYTRLLLLSILSLLLIFGSACSSTRVLTTEENISIKIKSLLYKRSGTYFRAQHIDVTPQKVIAVTNTGEQVELDRDDVLAIENTDRKKGMLRGAGYAALGAAGLTATLTSSAFASVFPPAAISLGLVGGGIGFLGGYHETIFLQSSKPTSSENSREDQIPWERSKFYVGVETGPIWAKSPASGLSTSITRLASSSSVYPVLEFGMTLNPHTLMGVRFGSMLISRYEKQVSTFEDFSDLTFVTTLFPKKRGLFWRAGGGLTEYIQTDDLYDPYHASHNNNSTLGLNALIGLGYASRLSRHMHLTFGSDLNNYFLSHSRSGHVLNLHLGLYWY
ncbi:MAG: hypothetical protein OEZ43_08665 [Gammaproteobacteria bacterium]|nr:hypothetical protein [Gammaproteobacteria bacterium]